MSLKEFYEEIGSNYSEVINRFGGMESLVIKFLNKFKEDQSFAQLKEAIESGDLEAIERHSHSLKGVAANLGLTRLKDESEAVMMHVRGGGDAETAKEMFRAVEASYLKVTDGLSQL